MTRTFWIRAAVVVLVLAVWQGVRSAGLISSILIASPSEILLAAVHSYATFAAALRISLVEIAVAIAIAMVLGIGTGTLVGMNRFLGSVSAPLLASLFAVPLITWYPMFVVWFGLGTLSKVAFGVVSAVFPITISTMNGLATADPQYIVFGRSIGCSRTRIAFNVLFPLALPSIVAGLRIGTSLAIIGVIVAEMLESLGGLGFVITSSRNQYAIGEVYLGILLALCCAIGANAALTRLERRFTRWRDVQAATN